MCHTLSTLFKLVNMFYKPHFQWETQLYIYNYVLLKLIILIALALNVFVHCRGNFLRGQNGEVVGGAF